MSERRRRRILVGKQPIQERRGIPPLLGPARQLGGEAEAVLVQDGDFQPLRDLLDRSRPDLVVDGAGGETRPRVGGRAAFRPVASRPPHALAV